MLIPFQLFLAAAIAGGVPPDPPNLQSEPPGPIIATSVSPASDAFGADASRSGPGGGEPLLLEPLISEVLRLNQGLKAFDSDLEAIQERAAASGALPNPSLGFAVRSLPVPSFSFTEDMMTMSEVMVRQQLPWFGKRELRREAAGKQGGVTLALAGSERLELAEAATAVYADLWLSLASREVLDRQEEALGRLSQLARARFAAGGERQADLLRAELALARIELPRLELQEREVVARAQLASLLSRDRPVAGEPILPELTALPSEDVLLAWLQGHPALKALEEQEEQARLETKLALRDRWPDPEVGVAYGVRIGAPDMIGVEVTIPIPLFAGSNQDRLAAAARAEAEAAARRRLALRESLAGEVRSAWAAASRQLARLRLYEEEVLPRAARSVEATVGAYRSGGVDFLSVLDAELQRHGQELEALEAKAAYLRERGRLARTSGSIESIFSAGAGGVHHE